MEIEDLQVKAMDELSSKFPGGNSVQSEEVVGRAAIEISKAMCEIITEFHSKAPNVSKITLNLHTVMYWTSICAFILEIECPTIQEIESGEGDWPIEVKHCGILACLMLQGKLSELTLDYFLSDKPEEEELEDNLLDIMSLVHVLAERVNIPLLEILRSK